MCVSPPFVLIFLLRNYYSSGTGKERNDEAMCLETAHNRQSFEWLILKFVAVPLDNIEDEAGHSTTDGQRDDQKWW